MERIGVVGLGRMGSAIAQRMTALGCPVLGWTRSNRTIKGVQGAPDLATLVAQSDTLILSLFDDSAVTQVLDALLALDLTGKQILDTSTVVPDIIKDRMAQIAAKGATAVDAPISGGPEMVLAGVCGIFIGGDDDAAQRAQVTLGAISNRMFHVGPLGTGLVMKVINNGMMQCYFNGLGDLMPLAKRAGLPMETAMRILSGGPAGMQMAIDRLPKILGEDKTVGFTVTAAYKDNDVFQRVVQSFGLQSPVLAHCGTRQRAAIEAGLGEDDPAALVSFAYSQGK
ncbi:MAG: 3-hydroxyisobutyrate dehydrogenase [Yoonia sp.]|jgi:3-hydroxyisobutyrate dehydrogenase